MKLHPRQAALLELLKRRHGDLHTLPLRSIGELIGVHDRAQVVAHHLEQLERKGYIRKVQPNQRLYEISENPVKEIAYINLYSTTAQCGPEGFFGEDEIVDKIPVSTKTFGISNPDTYFLIKAKGDSMENMVNEGDLVLARKQNDVDNGQIAVVVHEDMPKVKKILKSDGQYTLISLNPKYSDQKVVAYDDPNFRICGLVKGILRAS